MQDHIEALNFDRNVTVTLEGGYNCNYSSISGDLTVKGNIVISKGCVSFTGGALMITH